MDRLCVCVSICTVEGYLLEMTISFLSDNREFWLVNPKCKKEKKWGKYYHSSSGNTVVLSKTVFPSVTQTPPKESSWPSCFLPSFFTFLINSWTVRHFESGVNRPGKSGIVAFLVKVWKVCEFDDGQQIVCRRGISFGEEEGKKQHKNGDQTMDGERKNTKCCELKTAPSQMVYM